MKHHPLSWFPMSPATFSIIQIKQIPPSLPLTLILSSINIKKIKKNIFKNFHFFKYSYILFIYIYIIPTFTFPFLICLPPYPTPNPNPTIFSLFYIKYSNLHVRRNDNVQKSPPYLSTPRLHLSPH